MAILSTNNLSIGYRKGKEYSIVIQDLNITLNRGSLVALVGANGIGKSTLLRTLTGNQQPIEGSVTLDGKNFNDISKKELSKLLSIVNTDKTQAGGLTVRELVSLGRQPYTGFLGILDNTDRKIIDSAMQDAGIFHKSDSFLAELSDGERQKTMIAKALAQNTPVIILDEPTAFLDVESRMETMLLLHRLAHEQNKAILLSSHDLSQSMMLADELWIITHDRQLINGNTEDLALSGAMDRIFKSENISFDLIQGDYCIKLNCNKHVYLNCADKSISRCITNALARNGFGITNNNQCDITITASSPKEIYITKNKKTSIVHSIAEALTLLKD